MGMSASMRRGHLAQLLEHEKTKRLHEAVRGAMPAPRPMMHQKRTPSEAVRG
jgi:hypothetical protein